MMMVTDLVALVRLAGKRPVNFFALLHGQRIVQIENGLLPMRVRLLGPRGETHALVTLGELDAEVGDEGLDVVVAPDGDVERAAERQVLGLDRVEIDVLDDARAGDDLLGVDDVDQRLRDGNLADATHVEAVHVVPPVDLVVLVLPVLQEQSKNRCNALGLWILKR